MFNLGKSHSIIIPDKIELPLRMRGVMSFLETWKPTSDEIAMCETYELTSSRPWNPHELDLGDTMQVQSVIHNRSLHMYHRNDPPELLISSLTKFVPPSSCVPMTPVCSQVVHEADVISHEMVHHEAMATSTSAKGSTITKEALSKRWLIGLESAARTLQATTQLGMRYVEGPLEHHLRTSQAHMHFLSLNIVAYTDTMFSNLKSVRGYSCAQVFTNGNNFSSVYPM